MKEVERDFYIVLCAVCAGWIFGIVVGWINEWRERRRVRRIFGGSR